MLVATHLCTLATLEPEFSLRSAKPLAQPPGETPWIPAWTPHGRAETRSQSRFQAHEPMGKPLPASMGRRFGATTWGTRGRDMGARGRPAIAPERRWAGGALPWQTEGRQGAPDAIAPERWHHGHAPCHGRGKGARWPPRRRDGHGGTTAPPGAPWRAWWAWWQGARAPTTARGRGRPLAPRSIGMMLSRRARCSDTTGAMGVIESRFWRSNMHHAGIGSRSRNLLEWHMRT